MKKILSLIVLALLASTAGAGPADAVVRIPSQGGSGTIIATGKGWTLILSCAHCFEGRDAAEPIVVDMPHPASLSPTLTLTPQHQDLENFRKKVGVELLKVGRTADVDLSLFRVNTGPVPFVCPVAPAGYDEGDCLSVGYDEMILPAHCRPARIVAHEGNRTATDKRPWHGRSGGGLIRNNYLVGVVSAYTGQPGAQARGKGDPFDPRLSRHEAGRGEGVYASLDAIHVFLANAGAMDAQPKRPRPQPNRQAQPQQQR